jgi:hypothetical protein
MRLLSIRALLSAALAISASSAFAQETPENIRGTSTGPTTARGFSHAEQYIHLQDVKPADNMYPVVLHPEQDRAAREKLAPARSRISSCSSWTMSAGWTPASTAAAPPSAIRRR